PDGQTAVPGQSVTYTLTISNLESVDNNYTVSASGLATVTLPGSFFVFGGQAAVFTFTASANNQGAQPFTLTAVAPSGATDSDDAVVDIQDDYGVGLTWLNPVSGMAVAGPGSTAVYTLTVSNLGQIVDTYDLSVVAPTGWTAELTQFGNPVTSLLLGPGASNSQMVQVRLTPDSGATSAQYAITVTAQSQANAATTANLDGRADVSNLGVGIQIVSGPTLVDPLGTAVWDVQISNNGSSPDTYDLIVAGVFADVATFATNSVTLSPGASQTVQLTADNMGFLLPQTLPLVVAAQSQTESLIVAQDELDVTMELFTAVQVNWRPVTQTVTDTLQTQLTLIISNTGNIFTTYDLSSNAPGATSAVELLQVDIPAHMGATLLVDVTAAGYGVVSVTGTAVSEDGSTTDNDLATITFISTGSVNTPPTVDAGPNQTVTLGDSVTLAGSFTDPDVLDTHTAVVDWGDGTASQNVTLTGNTFTTSHTYAAANVYTATVTVSDDAGGVGVDTAVITVTEASGLILYLPVILAP
ncbi:MAG: hypothetical protein GY796_02100, partial [Chloroflexi bacterium]|nr:hypothetical protein [Chloroflexota bacterium]